MGGKSGTLHYGPWGARTIASKAGFSRPGLTNLGYEKDLQQNKWNQRDDKLQHSYNIVTAVDLVAPSDPSLSSLSSTMFSFGERLGMFFLMMGGW